MKEEKICTWKELQDHVTNLVNEHVIRTGIIPSRVHLPIELQEKFHEHFHNSAEGETFLYKDLKGNRRFLYIAKPISVS